MSRPAVAALDDARERVAALLWPPSVWRWLRLAVLVAFVGGGGASSVGGNLQLPANSGGVTPRVPAAASDLAAETLVRWLLALVAVVTALAFGYALVGAVAEFAILGALRDGDLRLRASVRRHAVQGLRLLVFRVAVVAGALLIGGGPAALAAWRVLRGDPVGVLVVPALLLAVVVALCAWLVLALTADLVVPAMLVAGVRGPLAGWRRIAGVVTANPVDVGLYLLLRVVLGVAAGVVVGLVGGLVALVTGVPFAAAGAATLAGAGSALSPVETAALGALALAFSLVTVALLQVVRTPVVCYLRAFAAATLGHLSPELALFAETDGHESTGGE